MLQLSSGLPASHLLAHSAVLGRSLHSLARAPCAHKRRGWQGWKGATVLTTFAMMSVLRGGAAEEASCEGVSAMPPMMYGTAWKKEKTEELVLTALKAGFRGVDTACQPKHYFEPGTGAALARAIAEGVVKREDVFLQTKYTPIRGQDPKNVPYDASAPLDEQVRQSMATSLRNLQTDYVDSLVMHSPLPTHKETMVVWREFEKLQASGAARLLGISNQYDPAAFAALYNDATIKPSVLQNRFYADSGYDKELRAFCEEKGVRYQSFWTLTGNPEVLASDAVRGAAARVGKTPEQVFFAFCQSQGITPLSGTTSKVHMMQDLEAATIELTPEEIAAIKARLK